MNSLFTYIATIPYHIHKVYLIGGGVCYLRAVNFKEVDKILMGLSNDWGDVYSIIEIK